MSRKTANLSPPYSVRMRLDQEEKVKQIIERMTADELSAIKDVDRSRFKYPELFKNAGRGPSPLMIMVRLALDDYLAKYEREEQSRQNPTVFEFSDDDL